MNSLSAVSLNCTLKGAPDPSSTDLLLDQIDDQFALFDVSTHRVRVIDAGVKHGVSADEGEGDGWPAIRTMILAANILVLGTPIWMGHPCSVAQQVLERLDAFLSDTDDRGQMRTVDRVGLVAVVGNEDGAHHVGAELFQCLSDTGFTIPAGGMTYWVGEAMHRTDYKDLDTTPQKTAQTTSAMVANAVHLAQLLAADGYPALTE